MVLLDAVEMFLPPLLQGARNMDVLTEETCVNDGFI
jgi:hypothetical protein